jgi:hypothetical protein
MCHSVITFSSLLTKIAVHHDLSFCHEVYIYRQGFSPSIAQTNKLLVSHNEAVLSQYESVS